MIPGCAEDAEQRVGRAPDIGPILLVVDPGCLLFFELQRTDLLTQHLHVVAANGHGNDVGFCLLHFQQIGGEIARILRHQQIVDDLAAAASTCTLVAADVVWPHT